jgi:hypothetical protein
MVNRAYGRWLLALVGLLGAGAQADAGEVSVIDPSDDGALYVCGDCNPNPVSGYLLVSGYIQGVTVFSTSSIHFPISAASLSVNPYGLPLFAPVIDVYGFAEQSGVVSMSYGTGGTFLGAWTLPPGLGYGQDAFFDVTSFLASVNAPYVGFALRAPDSGPDVLSSLTSNYGHPEQLTVTSISVPEPGVLDVLGLALVGVMARRRRHSA